MITLKGLAASNLIAIGKAHKMVSTEIDLAIVKSDNLEQEVTKFLQAIDLTKHDLSKTIENVNRRLGAEEALIFKAQLMMLTDITFIDHVIELIKAQKIAAHSALNIAIDELIDELKKNHQKYFQDRIIDLTDLKNNILNHLVVKPTTLNLYLFFEPTIIVAKALTPSDTAKLDTTFVKGLVIEEGGLTSHSAILANKLGIPVVFGIDVDQIADKVMIGIDGDNVIIDPIKDTLTNLNKALNEQKAYLSRFDSVAGLSGATKDGVKIEIAANLSTDKELKETDANDIEAVGLVRTEFVFLNSEQLPTLDEQMGVYQNILTKFKTKKVVMRILDIGGDKPLKYLPFSKEVNPFLGQRGIRFLLNYPRIFNTQIKAMLLANEFGNLHIMLPMVSTVEEVKKAKTMIEEAKSDLINQGHQLMPFKLGIMVEVPSICYQIKKLKGLIDFISIGSNDLIQYFFAADRLNSVVSNLYQPYHPALLALIAQTVADAHEIGIWVGVCGEMAGIIGLAMLLVGLGIDELSMSVNPINKVKWHLSKVTLPELQHLAKTALTKTTNKEVIALVEKAIKGLADEF